MTKQDREHLESGPHSFIVKIWPEETDSAGKWFSWRGQVTHVPVGTKMYFDDLNDLAEFITSSLAEIGVTLSHC